MLVALSCTVGVTDLVPMPPADDFSRSVDAAAARWLGSGRLSCNARDAMDLSGDAAFVWGSTFHVASAAECCEACAAHRSLCGPNASRGKKAKKGHVEYWDTGTHKLRCGPASRGRCNAFVFCAAEQCFSYDVHVHKKGECWLKHEPNVTAPIAAGPTLPKAMREAPRAQWPWAVSTTVWPAEQPPERIQWQSGIVARKETATWKNARLPGWHKRFCNQHGPC